MGSVANLGDGFLHEERVGEDDTSKVGFVVGSDGSEPCEISFCPLLQVNPIGPSDTVQAGQVEDLG